MLAYHILGSANPQHAARLLKWIYSAENRYLITFDNPTALEKFQEASKAADNIRTMPTPPVTWGGISMVTSILRSLRTLLQEDNRWEFFILLSDSDVPLKPQDYIRLTLAKEAALGKDSFIHINQESYPEIDFGILDYSRPYAYHKLLPVRDDVKFLVHEQLIGHFEEITQSPIYITKKRVQFHVTDSRHDKLLYIRPLEQVEADFRKSVFSSYTPRFGKVWCILSRRTCNWLLQWKDLSLLFAVFGNTFCSDESFLQTALGGPHFPWFEGLDTSNRLRWHGGTADVISDEKLSSLSASECLFARKVHPSRSDCLFDWIDSWSCR